MTKPTSESWLGSVDTFEAAFPKIEDFLIEGEVTNGGARLPFGEGQITISRRNLSNDYFPCRNPSCHHGGFFVGEVLSDMSRNGQSEGEIKFYCRGSEGHRKPPKRCMYALHGTIKITFKPNP